MSELTIYHMQKSQSERIVWLCEELEIDYNLKIVHRNSETGVAPPELKKLHPSGTAPIMTDGEGVVIAESAAIVEYIINIHGGGRLAIKPGSKNYVEYLTWWHFSNGSLQPALSRNNGLNQLGEEAIKKPAGQFTRKKLTTALQLVNERLGKAEYLAGDEFSAADIMTVFSLSTMRGFVPVDLSEYPNILRYLKLIGGRSAYSRAMERAGDTPMLEAQVQKFQYGHK